VTLPKSVLTSPYKIVLYCAVNLVNGKRYIGITQAGLAKRVGRHFKSARFYRKGSIFGAAIRKYKQANIRFSVMAVCPSWDYAKDLEVAAIAKFKPEYNVTLGGDGAPGYKHTEDHKRRVSLWQTGNKHWLGKRHSVETIEKMRESARRLRAQGCGGFKNGHKLNPKKFSFYAKRQRNKPVTSLVTGETYNSVLEASKMLKCQRSYIRESGNFIVGWVVAPAL
jgi:group I intron endonuclease